MPIRDGNQTGRKQMKHGFFFTRKMGVLLLGSLLLSAPLSAQAAQNAVNAKSEKYYRDAQGYLDKGDINAASIQLKNAIRSDPSNVRARYDLARIYLFLGDYAAAEKELTVARERGMEDEKILPLLAEAYLRQLKFDKVLEIARPGDFAPELNARLLIQRANAYLGKNDVENAEAELERAEKLAPDLADVYIARARLLDRKGNIKAAEAAIDKALSLQGDNLQALVLKGDYRRRQGDYVGAGKAYDAALKKNPNNPNAGLGRIFVLIATNKLDEAQKAIDQFMLSRPLPMVYYLQALLFARKGELAPALNAIQEMQSAASKFPPALYMQAVLNMRLGQTEQALSFANQYHALVPKDLRGNLILAELYLRRREPQAAIEILKPVEAKAKNNFALLNLMGNAYLVMGDAARANEYFSRALALAPENTAVKTRRAESLLAGDDITGGIDELEKIVKEDPKATRANVLLIMTYLRQKEYDKALAAAERLKAASPESPVADNFRGAIFRAKGEFDKAKAAFEAALKTRPDYFPAAMNLADMARAAGRMDEAEEYYRSILKQDEKNIPAMVALAKLEFARKNPEAAMSWLEKALRADAGAKEPRLMLIDALLRQGRKERALVVARDMVQALPNDAEAIYALARTQMAVGQTASALVSFRQLVSLQPDNVQARYNLAQALVRQKNMGDAVMVLDKAIEKFPEALPVRQLRLQIEAQTSSPEAALKLAREWRSEMPDKAMGDMLIADILYSMNRLREAEEAYRAALAKKPAPGLVQRLYQTLKRAGDDAAARKVLTDWLEDHENDQVVRYLLSSDMIAAGEYDAAIAEAEKILKASPKNAAVLNNLAWLYDQKKDPRAEETARKALALAPSAPEVADTLGWMLINKGKLEEGRKLLEQAHANAPKHPQIAYHLAVARARAGDTAGAVKVLEDLLSGKARFEERPEAAALLKSLKK